MPPTKKEAPTVSASAQAQQDAASDGIDHYELPKALVQRIAKSSIPENSKLQKETVTALQRGSTVFINYLAATAHDIATSRQHKSISASDVLKALEVIQFGDMVDPLQHDLDIYRQNVKTTKKGSTSTNKSSGSAVPGASDSVSARSKPAAANAKGKGKESGLDASHGPSPLSTSVSAADGDADMAEADGGAGEAGDEGDSPEEEDEEGDGPEEEYDELAGDVDEEPDEEGEGAEPEEIVDRMAVDEEEIHKDAKAANLGDGE